MSNLNKKVIAPLAPLIGVIVGIVIGGTVVHHLDAVAPHHQDHVVLMPKDPGSGPWAQGNAPQGGGPNADSGPGVLEEEPALPPASPRINPEPPKVCSEVTYVAPGENSTIKFVVPKDWSVWRCIEERFSDRDDQFLVDSVDYLKLSIKFDPSLKVRDPNEVPVGYTFYMRADGAGPWPVNQ